MICRGLFAKVIYTSRHSKSQGSVVAQEEERNIGWLSQARSTIEDTGIHEAGQQEPRKQISRSELAEYQKNSYVRVDLQKSDIILTDAFFVVQNLIYDNIRRQIFQSPNAK